MHTRTKATRGGSKIASPTQYKMTRRPRLHHTMCTWQAAASTPEHIHDGRPVPATRAMYLAGLPFPPAQMYRATFACTNRLQRTSRCPQLAARATDSAATPACSTPSANRQAALSRGKRPLVPARSTRRALLFGAVGPGQFLRVRRRGRLIRWCDVQRRSRGGGPGDRAIARPRAGQPARSCKIALAS